MVTLERSFAKLVDYNGGTISPEIFSSPELYAQELEQIFSRCWLFVGHVSEISNPGDFIRSRMGEEQVIVTRDRQRRISWFNEAKPSLEKRVRMIRTGTHWADEPLSRVSHVVGNVRVLDAPAPGEVRVKCRFVFYRNRHTDEESFFVGKRIDTLRRVDGRLKIARREIYLDQNVLLHKNLTSFF
jgi:3-phenylpropionate/cinnamic acid dioxygenase small subunit